jgi:light-regulated signal transduction histidine kinase (bacteriophytochrome)
MITSYLDLLSKRYKGKLGKDADAFIGNAVDGAERMKNLIRSLLLYSRMGREKVPYHPFDVNALLQTVLENLKVAIDNAEANRRGIKRI